MNHDEFAFFNQQLAAMLREGIPLEGALRQLCADMRTSPLRAALQSLEEKLARGVPLREAVQQSDLPELYQHLLAVGAAGNNLPGVLTLVADHYQRRYNLWTRLKGLMVYPVIVLISAFTLSCFIGYVLQGIVWPAMADMGQQQPIELVKTTIWMSPAILGVLVLAALIALATPFLRRALCWRLPAMRESSLAQAASVLSLMLRSGVPLDTALALAARLEEGTAASVELGGWRQQLAAGKGKFHELARPGRAFPPLFIWLVGRAGEDLAKGFERAAEIFQARAAYRAELILYSALPVSILALGAMILSQIQPVFFVLTKFMQSVGDPGV
jgi:type II secretory pathway component PulF